MFWFLGYEACGISAPRARIKPTPPALEGEVLTTGPPGKSPVFPLKSQAVGDCMSPSVLCELKHPCPAE